jgi:hypothetical protein
MLEAIQMSRKLRNANLIGLMLKGIVLAITFGGLATIQNLPVTILTGK